jgi:hypothetical protein
MNTIRPIVVALTLALPCSTAFAAQRSSSALNESEMHVGSGYTGQEWQGNTTAKKPKKLIVVGPRLSADEEHATSEFVLIVPNISSHENVTGLYEGYVPKAQQGRNWDQSASIEKPNVIEGD